MKPALELPQPPDPQHAQTSDLAGSSIAGDEGLSRRAFLGTGLSATAALTAGGVLLPAIAGSSRASAAQLPPPPNAQWRKVRALQTRLGAALANFHLPTASHPANSDESIYPGKWASFSKSLPHNAFGEVETSAYAALVAACDAGDFALFEAVPAGEPNPASRLRFVNPMSGVAFDMEGVDSHELSIPAAPAFASAEEAGEIVENYWMALLRDIPFTSYPTNASALSACADLTAMSDFRGPKVAGAVTPQTLFRVDFPGTLVGPYVSQFFWKSQPFGAQFIENRVRSSARGVDFMTTNSAWLAVQNGTVPSSGLVYDPTLRYMRNGRDLGEWVHIDVLYQAYFQAALHLLTPPDPQHPAGGGMGCAINPGNPYVGSARQDGFGTFGGPYFMTILTEVATRALRAVWFQKWYVHRRLRPEEFAGRIHHKIVSGRPYPIHADVLGSQALARVFGQNGSYFLPMAFPEGCPVHPAYGAGHATVAGACVTILKALFDTQAPFPSPLVAAADGLSISPYAGADVGQMTIEGELNKLAINVAFGRNIAGVHWRTDGTESLRLGEEVAISILRDQKRGYREPFVGFTFRRFDGTTVVI